MQKNHRKTVILGFCVLFLTLPPAVWAMDGQIKIGQPAAGESYPIVIDHAGSYVLTDNLVVSDPDLNAIEIVVNDVTLDLNGHTIHGPGTSGSGNGIRAVNRYSITIRNGRVWGFGAQGVSVYADPGNPSEKSAGHMVMDIQALNNRYGGILISAGTVSNCVANSNSMGGIWAYDTALIHCTANKNTGTAGIEIVNSSASNCTVNGNTGHGITAFYSTIDNMTANGNGSAGIYASYSSVANCTVLQNSGAGIFAEKSRIENNLVSQNKYYGLDIQFSMNFVIKNTGSANTPGNISAYPAGSYVPLIGSDNANVFF
jgi:parallel beta-helix repeat protein